MRCTRIAPAFLHPALESIGCDNSGAHIMGKKGEILLFLLRDLRPEQLHILKQELISVGGDLATPREAILGKNAPYSALVIATKSQLERVIAKCKSQPFGLKALSQLLRDHLRHDMDSRLDSRVASLIESNYLKSTCLDSGRLKSTPKGSCPESNAKSSAAESKNSPLIMPIINLTPDSFYAPSRHTSARAIESIATLIEQGAELIDIGAASSRPGSALLDSATEIARLRDVCEFIKCENLKSRACFSIDTYNAKTAAFALEAGFSIINDVSALHDPSMIDVVRDFGADVILMHTRGTPENMSQLTDYAHLISEIDEFFASKLELLESNNAGEVILDIGFGFAKNTAQNLALIQHLAHFKHFGKRLLVGASQKRSIGEILGDPDRERLSGTLALHLLALQAGADIIRAHHFAEHRDMLLVFQALRKMSLALHEI